MKYPVKFLILLFSAAFIVSSAMSAMAADKPAPEHHTVPYDYPAKKMFEAGYDSAGRRSLMDMFINEVDIDKFIKSGQVDALVNSYKLYIKYNKPEYELGEMDPGVIKYWDDRGIIKTKHSTNGRTIWYSYVPKEALDKNNQKKFPLIFNLPHEDPFECEMRGYVELAAKERLIVVIPTVTNLEDLMKQYVEVKQTYPMVDTSRFYMSGFSFTGFRTEQFALRFPEVLAGIAFNCHLWPYMWEMPQNWLVDKVAEYKMPMMQYVGAVDLGGPLPLTKEITEPHPRYGNDQIHTAEQSVDRVNMWFRINDVQRIPYSAALATVNSESKVERMIGAPVSRGKTEKVDGTDYYYGDFISSDGVYRTRLVNMDNIPHWPFGSMAEKTWDFLKHFSRDLKTGDSLIDGELPL